MRKGIKHLTDDPIADMIKYDGGCNWCHGDMRKCVRERCPAQREIAKIAERIGVTILNMESVEIDSGTTEAQD